MDSWFPTFRRLLGTQVPFPALWPSYTTRGQRQSLLRLIVVATEENLPLASLLENWAADERGVQQRRLIHLVKLLKAGTTLADAVEQTAYILSDDEVLAIRFGAQSGTLAASVRQSLDEAKPGAATRSSPTRGNVLYIGIVIIVGFFVVTFLQIRIVPEFKKILQEFSLDEPPILRWSVGLAHAFVAYWWLPALLLFAIFFLASSARPGRRLRTAILSRFFRPARELRAADVLQKLSLVTEAGRPISGALSTLARYHFDPMMRHQLLFVRNEIEHGADVWESMAGVGMLTSPEVRVLNTSARVGNRSWVLKQLALGKLRRTKRRLEQLSEFALPALVVLLGAIVLFQALSVFLPLLKIIESLA